MSIDPRADGITGPLIPGAYERNTLTYREPDSMRADVYASVPVGSSMDAATIAAREREGGGAPSQRRRKVQAQAQVRTGPALRGSQPRGFWGTGGLLWLQILRLARR
jgi:hypothetical protein